MGDEKCDSEFNGYCSIKAGSCDYSGDVYHCPYKQNRLFKEHQIQRREVHDRRVIDSIDIGLIERLEI